MSLRSLGSQLLGFALGASAVWCLHDLGVPAGSSASPGLRPVSSASTQTSAATGSVGMLVLPAPISEADADAALDDYLALPPLPKDAPLGETLARLDRLSALLTVLPDPQLARLMAALAHREGDAEVRLRRAAFDAWIERDAPAAAHWALAIVPGAAIDAKARSHYLNQASLAWAREDFAAAYAWAGSLGDAAARRDLLPPLLSLLATTDPRQALSLAKNGDEAFIRDAERAVLIGWAKHDPAAALRTLGPGLLQQPDPLYDLFGSICHAMEQWSVRDPAAALDWALAQPIPDGDPGRSILGFGWVFALNHPEAVRPFLDALALHDDAPNRARVTQGVFGSWVRGDRSAALAWLETLPDGAQRSDLVISALNGFGTIDDFMALARRVPDSQKREEKIVSRLSWWAKEKPEAALAWMAEQDDPALVRASSKVEGGLIVDLAASAPAAAVARWEAMPPGDARIESAVPLAAQWARSDSPAATRWLFQQLTAADPAAPQTVNIASQLRSVTGGWIAQDPAGYFEWVETLPAGAPRERAIETLANSSPYARNRNENLIDPPPRAAYAEKLSQLKDPAIRERALHTHLAAWLRSDLHSARAWIESSESLSPEAAARLLTDAPNH
jgi:hypothetical protein